MSNKADYRELLAEIARKQALIEAMESSFNCPQSEVEKQKRLLKGLLLEKEERDKKRTSSN